MFVSLQEAKKAAALICKENGKKILEEKIKAIYDVELNFNSNATVTGNDLVNEHDQHKNCKNEMQAVQKNDEHIVQGYDDEMQAVKKNYEQMMKGYDDTVKNMEKDKNQLQKLLKVRNEEFEKLKFELDHAKLIIQSLEVEKVEAPKSPIRNLFPNSKRMY